MKTWHIVLPVVASLIIAAVITVLLLRKKSSPVSTTSNSVQVASSAGNTSPTTSSNATPTTVVVTTSSGAANNTVAVAASSQAPPAVYVAAVGFMKNQSATNAEAFMHAYQADPALLAILSNAIIQIPSDAGSGTAESLALNYMAPQIQTLYGPIYAPVILLAFKNYSSAVNAAAVPVSTAVAPPGPGAVAYGSIIANLPGPGALTANVVAVSTPVASTIAIR